MHCLTSDSNLSALLLIRVRHNIIRSDSLKTHHLDIMRLYSGFFFGD